MIALSPEAREALKLYCDRIKEMQHGLPYMYFHDIECTHTEEDEKMSRILSFVLGTKQVLQDALQNIKNILQLCDEAIECGHVGEVLRTWDFETPEPLAPDETNPF